MSSNQTSSERAESQNPHDRFVSFTLAESDQGENMFTATFTVPIGLEEKLCRNNVNARGASFELTLGATPGRLMTTFYSTDPHEMAEAIRIRLVARVQDPSPPGAEECSIMWQDLIDLTAHFLENKRSFTIKRTGNAKLRERWMIQKLDISPLLIVYLVTQLPPSWQSQEEELRGLPEKIHSTKPVNSSISIQILVEHFGKSTSINATDGIGAPRVFSIRQKVTNPYISPASRMIARN
jgi:hypothetical protein